MKKYNNIQILCKCLNSCNQNCSYCFDKKFHSKEKTIIRKEAILNFIDKLFKEFDEINWIWHGGEILLVGKEWFEEIMYDIIILANTIPNSRINFSLQTNGTLLTQDWYDLLDKFNVSCSISWDGAKNLNSRGYSLKEEILNVVPSTITVINENNYDKLIDLYKYFSTKNLLSISYNFLFPHDKNYKPFASDENLIREYKKFVEYYLYNDGPIERTTDSFILMSLGNAGSICQHINCTNFNFLVLDNEEKIWKCDNKNNPFMLLGSLKEYSSYDEFLNNSENYQKMLEMQDYKHEKCENCLVNWACEKGCLNCRVWETEGKEPYSFYCKLIQEIVPFLFDKLYNLTPEEFVKLNFAVKKNLIQSSYLPQYILDELMGEDDND